MEGKKIPFKQRGRLMINWFTAVSLTKKNRRHSGWRTGRPTIKAKKQEILDECLEPQPFYDAWWEYRDGLRNPFDRTKLRYAHINCSCDQCGKIPKENAKLKKQIKIRRARKRGRYALTI